MKVLYSWQREVRSASEAQAAPGLSLPTADLDSAEGVAGWLRGWLALKLNVRAEELEAAGSDAPLHLDSLAAIELAHAIESAFQLSLPMWELLQGSSVAQLAAQILDQRRQQTFYAYPVEPSAEPLTTAPQPLSYGQRSLWFLYQMSPESSAYHIAGALRIPGQLDVQALRRAFQAMVDRHASVRATLGVEGGEPRQRVREGVEVKLEEEDATGWSEELLQEHLASLARQPFDLEEGPLFRLRLFKRPAQEHVLLTVLHHVISDLWSVSVLVDELRLLYAAEREGTKAELPPVVRHYTDFVRWQRAMLESAEGERLWNYWREQLSGELPILSLPTDRPRPPVQTFQGASYRFKLDRDLTAELNGLSRAHGATPYMTLLAAFQLLLSRYSGQEELLVGSPSMGRSRPEWRNIVGYFVNPLVLRARLRGNPRFTEFLAQVRQTVLDAFEHQDYPFTLLVERLQSERDASRSPLFQVSFVFQKPHKLNEEGLAAFSVNESGARLQLGELTLELLPLERRVAQFDLSLVMSEVNGELKASCEYNTDLFETTTIARLCSNFETLLRALVNDPQERVSALPLLGAEEQRQMLVEWNETTAFEPSPACLHELFEAQVERTPGAVAVLFAGEQLTYQELNGRSNQLARRLRDSGVGPEAIVGILLPRSLEMVVAVLAVLKAGGAYLPLDPGYPLERLSFMLGDARVKVLLTGEQIETSAPGLEAEILRLSFDQWDSLSAQPTSNLDAAARPDNLAYVIYTSGSTGTPKGVMISHRAIVNHMRWMQAAYPLSETDCVVQKSPFSFDASVWEFYAPLFAGARLAMAPPAALQDLRLLVQTLREHGVTVIQAVPTLLQVLLDEAGFVECRSLKRVFCGGEPLTSQLQERFLSLMEAELVNLYGPTEATIDTTFHACQRDEGQRLPPIGRPIAHTRVYLLNSDMQPVPVGVAGEIYIGGAALARGYLGRAEATAEKFVPHPFSAHQGARLYRTGDLGRYLADGNIEFIGRVDGQVKVRGYRIELGEIEAVLSRHTSVKECAVMVREDTRGNGRLVAYVVAERELETGELRDHLRQQLPDYMLPQAFVQLDALPLTASGKVDRRALPKPDPVRPATLFVAARTERERALSEMWTELLGVERVGVFDDFFALGGHSLLATQLMSRVRSTMQVELPLRVFFESPTIAGLAEKIGTVMWASGAASSSSESADELRQTGEL